MRTISAALLDAQNSVSNIPYIHLLFTSKDGGTARNYSSDQAGRRILSLEHHEEPYNDYAIIALRDNDRTVPNVAGYWVEIGYGYYTGNNVAAPDGDGAGNEYSESSRLWVKQQQEVSAGGQLFQVLELEGMWSRMHETVLRLGSAPYHDHTYTDTSIYNIITAIMSELGFTLDAIGSQDDGIMSAVLVDFIVNEQPMESAVSVIYRLLIATYSYLRAKKGLAFKVMYPQAADSVDIAYYSYQNPYFLKYSDRDCVAVPNKVYVMANQGADGLWTSIITATAQNDTEIARYPETPAVIVAGNLTTQAQANARALVVLNRAVMETKEGIMDALHDCRLEILDKVSMTDTRSGSPITYPSNGTLRVSGIQHIYTIGTYRMEVSIGGLSNTDEIALSYPQSVGGKKVVSPTATDFPVDDQFKGDQTSYMEDFWSNFPGGDPAQRTLRPFEEKLPLEPSKYREDLLRRRRVETAKMKADIREKIRQTMPDYYDQLTSLYEPPEETFFGTVLRRIRDLWSGR